MFGLGVALLVLSPPAEAAGSCSSTPASNLEGFNDLKLSRVKEYLDRVVASSLFAGITIQAERGDHS